MKRIFYITSVMLALAIALGACGPKEPANHLEAIQQEGKMVVGTSADYPPFEFIDEDNELAGYDIDLIREIGDRMGLEVEIKDMPFDSLIAAVQEGKIDLTIAAFNYDAERDEKVDFTDAYSASYFVFVVQEGFEGELNTLEDLAQYNLAVQTGTTQESWVDKNLIDPGLMPEDQKFVYERVDQEMLDVKSGRVDIAIPDNVTGYTMAEEIGGLKVLEMPRDIVEQNPIQIIVPEGDDALREAINDVLADLKEEGYLEDLDNKWLKGE